MESCNESILFHCPFLNLFYIVLLSWVMDFNIGLFSQLQVLFGLAQSRRTFNKLHKSIDNIQANVFWNDWDGIIPQGFEILLGKMSWNNKRAEAKWEWNDHRTKNLDTESKIPMVCQKRCDFGLITSYSRCCNMLPRHSENEGLILRDAESDISREPQLSTNPL